MIRMFSESMQNLKSVRIINQYICRLSTGGQHLAVMGEPHCPDFSGILTEFKNGSQRKLTSITHMICEKGRRP